MYRLLHQTYQQDRPIGSQNVRNKTIKKQLPHRQSRFNETSDKQNKYCHSNLMLNFSKDTIRKTNENTNEQEQILLCKNHPQRNAEFIVQIEEEILTYCRKCATHIASQGFDVHKISTSPLNNLNKKNKSSNSQDNNILAQNFVSTISPNRKRNSLSNKDNRIQYEKRSQLLQLTNSLKGLKQQYIQKSHNLDQICSTFSDQKETLINYYSQLISYIEEIRDSHIQAIEQSSIDTVQICEIEKGQVEENVDEIDEIIFDIESNMENILSQVDEKSYAQCYDFYKQKQGFFNHRLEQIGSEAKPWPCTSQQQIKGKIQNFKQFVNQLHEVSDQPQEDGAQSVMY